MNIVIAAGGTGGHLYPAIALAREFQRQDPITSILFVGTARGLEANVLAREGFQLAEIAARGVMGRGVPSAIGALLCLPVALAQSVRILRARRADLVIGTGGYTSPPVVGAALLLGINRVILEPNVYPGVANRLLGWIAHRVFLAFEATECHFRRSTVRVVGTPIRREFYESLSPRHEPGPIASGDPLRSAQQWVPNGCPSCLLIFGGSQGSHAINEAMVAALPHLRGLQGSFSVVHQTGEADRERVEKAYQAMGVNATVVSFLFDMPQALRSADLVVSRAGAVTVAELAACGKPAILIPLSHAIHQHQERNARVVEAAGGAVVLRQDELNGSRLAQVIEGLLRDPDRLRAMGGRSRALGRPDSAEAIVRECRALMARKARGERQ